jgi:peptide/nickel transport system substrate-binding protein
MRFYFPLRSADMDPHNVFTPVRAAGAETLLKLDEDSNIEGWLEEKWETSEGGVKCCSRHERN